jgi:hypothetical protein
MRMETMDSIKGGQELARRLEERYGIRPEAVRPAQLADSAAVPIFHWLGIEPPLAPGEEKSAVVPRTGRRRRLTSYLR